MLTLEDAIRKFTSLPAQRMRLGDRGVLKVGMWADVVVFDPDQVRDRATFAEPNQLVGGDAVGAGERRPGHRGRPGDRRAAGAGAAGAGVERGRSVGRVDGQAVATVGAEAGTEPVIRTQRRCLPCRSAAIPRAERHFLLR